MKFKVVIAPDGATQVIAQEGSFATASAGVLALLEQLRAQGLTISEQSEPEQHRHDPEVTVHGHSHN